MGLVPRLWRVQLPLAPALPEWDLGAGLGSALMLGRAFSVWPACLVTRSFALSSARALDPHGTLPRAPAAAPAKSLKREGEVGAEFES